MLVLSPFCNKGTQERVGDDLSPQNIQSLHLDSGIHPVTILLHLAQSISS